MTLDDTPRVSRYGNRRSAPDRAPRTGLRGERNLPPGLVEAAMVAYVLVVLILTTGPQPPGRFDLIGNIVLFVPVGTLLVLRFPGLHPFAVVLAGFALSALIEGGQLLVLTHRHPSPNDLALNTAGTALGAVAGLTLLDLLGWWRRRGR